MKPARSNRRGSAILEFTLVGIPVVFILIATFEIGRWAWTYHTLAHTATEATRYAAMHGNNCATYHNSCTVRASAVATAIRSAGLGLDQDALTVTLRSSGSAARTIGPVSLRTLLGQTGRCWPVNDDCTAAIPGATTSDELSIDLAYDFRSAMVMFWPGVGGSAGPASLTLRATSRERVHF